MVRLICRVCGYEIEMPKEKWTKMKVIPRHCGKTMELTEEVAETHKE